MKKSAAPNAATPQGVDIVELLLKARLLKPDQAERVRRTMRLNAVSADQAVIKLGFADEVRIAQAIAEKAGLPFVKIDPLELDLDIVTKALSGPFARRHGIVAVSKTEKKITIAVHDPFAPFPIDDIRLVTGLDIERVVATRSDVERINRGFYDLQTSLQSAEKQLRASRLSTVDLGSQEFLSAEVKELDAAAAPVIRALDHILAYAFEQRASDIHFEPKRKFALIRLRIDGMLHDVHVIPRIVYDAVASRIKLLSGCNIAEKRRPQDGRIKRDQSAQEIELRVSTMPTAFGEKVVMRIFDPDIVFKGIDDLGLSTQNLPRFYELISHPTGIILVTGPTGSGKTTTLYSVLKYLSRPEINIVTIEDPIEMVYEDFNQVAVKPQIDVTFASALRTVLRQDPDIIMVGEIRDPETAEYAVQAALTGHLVLSTLHTNDAPSSITRLLDLGVPHFLVTSTVIGILAQRLVRQICPHCAEEYVPTPEEASVLRMPHEKLATYRFKRGRGCLRCRETGYTGRIGVFEVLPLTEKIRRFVASQSGSSDIVKAAREEGMRTLREAAVEKVFRGMTTLTEVVRVTGK
ncbi:MAG: type II/IV secretion system protein [Vicinamibacteria bacterium]|nr:type II/IV secretion system protein [Vicinamibacteria bacterium]